MNFTKGQLYFAIFFIIVFVVGMIWSYTKDKNHRNFHYKGILKIGIILILIVVIFASLTFWIHE